MVCCAAYWQRHEIDEAGKVGTSLQKILFFLSAITVVSFMSFEPTTVLCGASALLLYAVGLIGAQKRDIRYLWTYGAVSIVLIVMSIVFGIALLGLILAHPQPHNYLATNYGYKMPATLLRAPQHGVFVEKQPNAVASTKLVALEFPKVDAVEFHGVYREQAAAVVAAPQKELLQKRQAIKSLTHNDARVQHNDAREKVDDDRVQLDVGVDGPETDDECQLSPFGIFVIAVAGLLGIFLFALKVKSICLAFRMRRMLVALAAQRLPITINSPAPITSKPVTSSTATFAPTLRRDCERCTFVNAESAVRCAMCDTPLAPTAAPVQVVAPPRVYAPGALY